MTPYPETRAMQFASNASDQASLAAAQSAPSTGNGNTAREVVTLLTVQRDLYARLRGLAEQQRSVIHDDRPEVLLHLLTERQTIVNRLARLNAQLAPHRRTWDVTYAALPQPQREEVTRLLGEINGFLRTILTTDEEDSALLAARKRLVADELAATGQQRFAAKAYAGAVRPHAESADLEG